MVNVVATRLIESEGVIAEWLSFCYDHKVYKQIVMPKQLLLTNGSFSVFVVQCTELLIVFSIEGVLKSTPYLRELPLIEFRSFHCYLSLITCL